MFSPPDECAECIREVGQIVAAYSRKFLLCAQYAVLTKHPWDSSSNECVFSELCIFIFALLQIQNDSFKKVCDNTFGTTLERFLLRSRKNHIRG